VSFTQVFDLHVSISGDIGTLRPAGEIELSTADAFREAIEALERLVPAVRVDLSRVSFMDSTGLTALLEARRRAAETPGRSLKVVRPSPFVRRFFAVVGVAPLFERRFRAAV
jgi:anti-sigma B factor antagonist